MTVQVNIAKAKATLSELVARAEAGEEVVLSRDGKPVVTLTPVASPKTQARRKLGIWNHLKLNIPDDLFIGPDPTTLAAVDGPVFPSDDETAA
jgi:prevent-host-death family protein